MMYKCCFVNPFQPVSSSCGVGKTARFLFQLSKSAKTSFLSRGAFTTETALFILHVIYVWVQGDQ